MRLVPLLLLAASSLSAEFLQARIEIGNMDCVTCVQSLEMGLKKIRGVEKVTVGPQNSADFVLQPGNKVTLERLRDAIKGVGFTPNTAHVIVRGKPVTAEGQWRFEVDGIAKTYNLSTPSNDTVRAIRARDGQVITVKAVSPPPPDPRTMPSLAVDSVVEPR
ncbi:MAG: heavy-metal-associated domain-containing protein [Bryobacteraceae bacterium]